MHLALEHGVWNRMADFHLHVPFFGGGHDDRLNPHRDDENLASAGVDQPSPADRQDMPRANHEHHGLPDLLQGGLIDSAVSSVTIVPTNSLLEGASDFFVEFFRVSRLDFVRAPRPPPAARL